MRHCDVLENRERWDFPTAKLSYGKLSLYPALPGKLGIFNRVVIPSACTYMYMYMYMCVFIVRSTVLRYSVHVCKCMCVCCHLSLISAIDHFCVMLSLIACDKQT